MVSPGKSGHSGTHGYRWRTLEAERLRAELNLVFTLIARAVRR